jgi:peptidoglycan/xylan/chitin deacetylase (PgdA/CDA1 family)
VRILGLGRVCGVARSCRNALTSRGLILLYHRVAEVQSDPWSLSVTPEHFAEHLKVLQKVGRPARLCHVPQNLRRRSRRDRPLVVTFDDGYADNLHNAKPLLERYEIPATVFVTTGYLEQNHEFWWDQLDRLLLQSGTLPRTLSLDLNGTTSHWDLGEATDYSEVAAQRDRCWRAWDTYDPTPRHSLYRFIYQALQPLPAAAQRKVLDDLQTWAGVQPVGPAAHRPLTFLETAALAQGGLVEVGSHTVTHPILSAHAAAVQREELQRSKARLEGVLDRPVTSFAYPYGRPSDYTAETAALVREAGFVSACSASAGVLGRDTDPFQLPRVHVEDCDGERFARWLWRWFDD